MNQKRDNRLIQRQQGPPKILTFSMYFRLIYESFFKGITFEKKAQTWSRRQKLFLLVQGGLYSTFFTLIIISLLNLILSLDLHLWKMIIGFITGFVIEVLFGISTGVVFGFSFGSVVLLGMSFESVFGFGLPFIITFGIASGVAMGTATSIFGKVVRVITVGTVIAGFWYIIFWISVGISSGITIGIAFILFYLLVLGRLFYFPLYLPAIIKKVNLLKLPWRWDENIGLPIPFLTQILIRQAEFNQTAAIQEALFLIRERPVHRKTAQKSLTLLTIRKMKQFRTVREIAYLQQQLSYLPESMEIFEADFNHAYQSTLALAQNARIVESEKNHSNRLYLLKKLCQNTIDFQKQMDFTKAKTGLLFGEVAACWHEIVQHEIKLLEAESSRPLPNPFITGNPIRPEHNEVFAGRLDIIRQIQTEALREGGAGAILFIGQRRTGKTSTLLNLKNHLSSNLKPVFIDCQSPMITSGKSKGFCSQISKAIKDVLGKKMDSLGTCSTLTDLTHLLETLQLQFQIILPQQNFYLLICFDEYEKLTPQIMNGGLAGLPDAFRYWIQHLPNFIFLLAGSHSLNEIRSDAVDWSDYLINVRTVPISYLDYDSALRLVTQPVPEYDLHYEPSDLPGQLVRRCGGQPYLIQVVMFELTEYLNSKNIKVAEQADIETAIAKMFVTASNYFTHLWQSELTEAERETLLTIANRKSPADVSEKTLKSLIRKEILRKEEDGEYAFCVPVLQEWILKYI